MNINIVKNNMTLLIWGIVFLTSVITLSWLLIDGTGHDYAYFFPKMLDTHLFYKQNGLTLQEYTPSYCAGIFVFANPQSISVSIPQLLLFITDPVNAIRITFVIISIMGAIGIYLTSRKLKLPVDASILAATIYSFSGFFIVRMTIGHLAFHSAILAPFIAWIIIESLCHLNHGKKLNWMMLLIVASFILSFAIYSGVSAVFLQMITIIYFIVFIFAIYTSSVSQSILSIIIVTLLTALISAPKIEAILSLLNNLPRNLYPLPGFNSYELILFLKDSIFYIPSTETSNHHLINKAFNLGWHELYYSTTPIISSLIIILLLYSNVRKKISISIIKHWQIYLLSFLYILIPIILNLYSLDWNNFLKELPIIGQSSNLLRWFFLYIPAISYFSALLWKYKFFSRKSSLIIIPIIIIFMSVFQAIIIDKNISGMTYNPSKINAAWRTIENNNTSIPPISNVGMIIIRQHNKDAVTVKRAPNFDHAFLSGGSNALCYEPLFGYRLEKFTIGQLLPISIHKDLDGEHLNFKNPSCYVYPSENNCSPGDHFTLSDKEKLKGFASRENTSFAYSHNRKISNKIAIFTIIICLLLIGYNALNYLTSKIRQS